MEKKMSRPKDSASRILNAADELFGELGYDAVSISDVARKAQVNKALVFYYYSSKAELFEQVIERYYAAHAAVLAAVARRPMSVRQRLHDMLDAYFRFMATNWRYPRLIQQQVSSNGPHLESIQRNLAMLFESIRVPLEDLAVQRPETSARQFFVTFSGMVINYFTYAPVLSAMWGTDPLAEAELAARRSHLHWVLDGMLDKLDRESAQS
ncbi:MAG: TetR/AcrR family transcriptional regulator [Candidatus Schekmanbacteria bacterium]|nr:TetR/AcrR family transcriptional regulator [Candidatus Schekmanbacteria bacterium]